MTATKALAVIRQRFNGGWRNYVMNVYILKSLLQNRYYVGITKDINMRIAQHNNGENQSTKAYRPWILIKAENYKSKSLALKRERFLKSGVGRRVIKNIGK